MNVYNVYLNQCKIIHYNLQAIPTTLLIIPVF